MARKEKTLARQRLEKLSQIHDIVVDPLAALSGDFSGCPEIVLPALDTASCEVGQSNNNVHSKSSFDRRQLMLMSKQHSSSARLLVERLSAGSNRVLGDTVQI